MVNTGDLLALFRPHLFFQFYTKGDETTRDEYPCDPAIGDGNVENNFAESPCRDGCVMYAEAEVLTDQVDNTPFWLLKYHLYYPANWNELARLTGPNNGYTHEHDWEWIYVYVVYDQYLFGGSYSGNYVGYAATLSAHNENNWEAMTPHSVTCSPYEPQQPSWNGTFLFPRVRNPIYDSEGAVSRGQVLPAWSTGNPYDDLYHLRATISKYGNEVNHGYPPSGVMGLQCEDCELVQGEATGWTTQPECEEVAGTMFYGEPGLSAGIIDMFGLRCAWEGSIGSRDECAVPRLVPWWRSRMSGSDAIVAYFDVPSAIETELTDIGPVEARVSLQWRGSVLELRWAGALRWSGGIFRIVCEDEDSQEPCAIADLPAEELAQYKVAIEEVEGVGQTERTADGWVVATPCLREVQDGTDRIRIEFVGEDRTECVASALVPARASSVSRVRLDLHRSASGYTVLLDVSAREDIELNLVDLNGRVVACLMRRTALEPGEYEVVWNGLGSSGERIPCGAYWIRARGESCEATQRIVLVR